MLEKVRQGRVSSRKGDPTAALAMRRRELNLGCVLARIALGGLHIQARRSQARIQYCRSLFSLPIAQHGRHSRALILLPGSIFADCTGTTPTQHRSTHTTDTSPATTTTITTPPCSPRTHTDASRRPLGWPTQSGPEEEDFAHEEATQTNGIGETFEGCHGFEQMLGLRKVKKGARLVSVLCAE